MLDTRLHQPMTVTHSDTLHEIHHCQIALTACICRIPVSCNLIRGDISQMHFDGRCEMRVSSCLHSQVTGRTALMEAVRAGAVALVRAIVKRGANVNMLDSKRFNAVHFAAEGGYFEVTTKYLSKSFFNTKRQASWF